MVVGTVATVAIIATGGSALAPITAVGATLGGTAGSTAAAVGTGSAVAAGIGVGASAGAIGGAGVAAAGSGSVVTGAIVGGLTGGTAAAGVGGSGVGLGTVVATVGTGGLGLLAVGASVNHEDDEVTYDCWKPVLHDTSMERSNGMLLKDIVVHPYVSKVTMATGICDDLPKIIVENIWNERFEIEYVLLRKSEQIACHAKPLLE